MELTGLVRGLVSCPDVYWTKKCGISDSAGPVTVRIEPGYEFLSDLR